MKGWRANDYKKEGGSGTHEWEQKSEQRRQCAVNRRLSRHLRRIKTGITIKVRRRYLPSSLLNLLPVCLYVCAHMLHFCPMFFLHSTTNLCQKVRKNQLWHLHFNKHTNSQKSKNTLSHRIKDTWSELAPAHTHWRRHKTLLAPPVLTCRKNPFTLQAPQIESWTM